ncbi:hypothetical protein ACCAA_530019 [Candidatus Accumulibacter aalborgensis]|uniref:Uncharacterized protein n=1 Tax=Candidatus Accumulibacter aalborgensis TaxID=1860102 RepID=A0A1A8XSR0_9PROT|nr:hypothetical protein ACCAA_530019 [Candidatus Accumulibacter aalborgensis]
MSAAEILLPALVRQAREAGAVIVMECAVGDPLVEDRPLLRGHGGRQALGETGLRQAILLARSTPGAAGMSGVFGVSSFRRRAGRTIWRSLSTRFASMAPVLSRSYTDERRK